MTTSAQPEDELLHSTALQNAAAILAARNRAMRELADAQEALGTANERLQNVLESITDGLAIVDRQWRIVYLNARADELFHRIRKGANELTGRGLWDEFPEIQAARVGRAFRRAMETGKVEHFEHFYAPLQSWFSVRAYPSRDGLSIYFQDVTRRKNAETLVEFEKQILSLIVDGAPLTKVLHELVAGVEAQSLEGLLCSVLLTSADGKRLVHGAAAGLPAAWNRAVDGLPIATDTGSCGTAAFEQRPVIVRDIANDPRWADWKALAATHGLAACASHPIFSSHGKVLGTVAVYYRTPREPGERDGQILAHAARLAGVVVERTRAEDALRTSEQFSRSIVQSSQDCIKTLTLDGRLLWVSEHGCVVLGIDDLDQAVGRSYLEFWSGDDREAAKAAIDAAARGGTGNFIGRFAVDGVPQWWNVAISPILGADSRPEELLAVSRNVTDRLVDEQRLREEARALELLNRSGTTLSANLDVETLVQTITDIATELSGAEFGAFFYNGSNAQGDVYLLYTLSGAPRAAFEKLGHPRATDVFGPTFRGEGIIRSNDITQDPRYGRWPPFHGMPPGHLPVRSYLAVPVTSRSGEVIGGLFFGHSMVGVFTERAEQLIGAVAAQAAVAIDNARLYQSAQRAAAEREDLLMSERSARADAERANRMKDEFLATLSHELRTPLSSILGWAHMLRSGRVIGADVERGLETIERNARAQAQLIEDLLDMSRIISGKLRLDVQPVEPLSFIEAALETIRPAADAKGIRIERIVDPAPGAVSGDPGRLQQIVWNLLSNAVKFTPKGGKVQLVLQRVDSHVEVSVADTGAGIEPELLDHVFERFRQVDSSATRAFGGLGLGLSIVKQLVEMHGGEVRAHSAGLGMGATFTVSLPLTVLLRDSAEPTQHPRASQAAIVDFVPVDLAGVRVLLVDDQEDSRELIGRVLVECGALVQACASGEEALAALAQARPHVILSDIGMPGLDGYRFLAQARAAGASMPAIALTAFARSEDRTRALRAGFLAHIAKPVEPSELVASIASAARHSQE